MKTIPTILGPMDEGLLERTTIFTDAPRELTTVIEYRFGGEIVHRSAHIILKEPSEIMAAIVGNTGG